MCVDRTDQWQHQKHSSSTVIIFSAYMVNKQVSTLPFHLRVAWRVIEQTQYKRILRVKILFQCNRLSLRWKWSYRKLTTCYFRKKNADKYDMWEDFHFTLCKHFELQFCSEINDWNEMKKIWRKYDRFNVFKCDASRASRVGNSVQIINWLCVDGYNLHNIVKC